MRRSLGRAIMERVWGRSRVYHVFTTTSAQSGGRPDADIAVYDRIRPASSVVVREYRHHAGRMNAAVMLRRMARGDAVLLTLMDGQEMLAYGWLQSWRCVAREFWWLSRGGFALGPFWTSPERRGRGLYGRMLGHSLAECTLREWTDLYIWARNENRPSISGIERAGFRSLGLHRVTVAWFGLLRLHEAL